MTMCLWRPLVDTGQGAVSCDHGLTGTTAGAQATAAPALALAPLKLVLPPS